MLTDKQKQLNRAIAERKGYKPILLERETKFYYDKDVTGNAATAKQVTRTLSNYALVAPDGNIIMSHLRRHTEDEAYENTPNWAGDLNLAWEFYKDVYDLCNFSADDDPAEVATHICKTWLKWYDDHH